eukprot:scaffold310_cov335-Pavlova_lutheri.AAC.77
MDLPMARSYEPCTRRGSQARAVQNTICYRRGMVGVQAIFVLLSNENVHPSVVKLRQDTVLKDGSSTRILIHSEGSSNFLWERIESLGRAGWKGGGPMRILENRRVSNPHPTYTKHMHRISTISTERCVSHVSLKHGKHFPLSPHPSSVT